MASATESAPGARRLRVGSARWLKLAAVVVMAGFATPLTYLVVRNLLAGDVLSRITDTRAVGPLLRTLGLGTAVAVSATVVGTGAAWVVARSDAPLRRLWSLLLPLPLVIPSFIGAFALLAAFAPGGLAEQVLSPLGVGRLPSFRGFTGATIVLTLLTYPYVYLPAVVRLRQLPRSLEESARLLGATSWDTFRTVVWPQLRGAVAAGSLLVFLYTISDFGAVQIMRYDTLTRVIYETRLFARDTSLALGLELATLALLVVWVERLIAPRAAAQATRGTHPMTIALGRWRGVAAAAVGALVTLSLLAPVIVLAYWALRGLLRGSTRAGALVTDVGSLASPALNTAVVSVVAAIIAVFVVLPVAYLTVRRRSRIGAAANTVIVGGFALPGLAIALALVFWTVRAPAPISALYQTFPLLVAAYVVHFGAQALRASQVAVAGVPPATVEAAQMLGASRATRFRTLELPLMLPALLAGAGLVLLSSMKELPATLLLAPPGFETLATRIWSATEDAFLADASLASLVLIALSGVLTWTLVIRRGESAELRA